MQTNTCKTRKTNQSATTTKQVNNENNRSSNNNQTKNNLHNRDWSVRSSAYRWLVTVVNAREHFLYDVGTAGAKTRTHQGIPLRIKIHNKQKKNSTNKRWTKSKLDACATTTLAVCSLACVQRSFKITRPF